MRIGGSMEQEPVEISEGAENVRKSVENGQKYIETTKEELEAGLGNIRPELIAAVQGLFLVL